MPDRDTEVAAVTTPHVEDGPSCPGCGLPNYSGLCPVCRGDEEGYRNELQGAFGPWHPSGAVDE